MRRFTLPEIRRLAGDSWAAGTPVLTQFPLIPTVQELRPALDGELRRSRRYERPLSLVVVVPDPHVGPPWGSNGAHRSEAQETHVPDVGMAARYEPPHASGPGAPEDGLRIGPLHWAQLRFLMLGSLLYGTFRESDIVSYAAEFHDFVALLPESDALATERAIQRLQRLYVSRMGTGLLAGAAVYPADGLTLDDLLQHARWRLGHPPMNPVARAVARNGASHA